MIKVNVTEDIWNEFGMVRKAFPSFGRICLHTFKNDGSVEVTLVGRIWAAVLDSSRAIFIGSCYESDEEFTAFLKEFYPEVFL